MATSDIVLSWLNDAYAMEMTIVSKLEDHVKDLLDNHTFNEKFPDMRKQISRHLEETKQHAEKVKGCIERLGGSTSTIKSGAGKVMGVMQEKAMGMAKDEIVKNVLGEYATEHMEIASYTSLIAAAEEVGDEETMRVCQEILDQEVLMASWLSEQIPAVTQEFLRTQQ